MPPETPLAAAETKTSTPITPAPTQTPAIAPNTAEARNPDGSLKDGLSASKTETTGETKSTETSSNLSESEKKLADAGKPAEGEKEPVKGVPEKYEFKNLPEGITVPDETMAMFKDKGLSQDQAQSMVDYYLKKSEEAAKQPYETWDKMNKEWLDTIQKDTEYKGDMKGVVTSISRLIDGVTGNDAGLNKEFRAGMDLTGAGNHPAFVKFMYRLSQQMNEGSYVKPGGPSPLGQRAPGAGERPSPAKALFPGLS